MPHSRVTNYDGEVTEASPDNFNKCLMPTEGGWCHQEL